MATINLISQLSICHRRLRNQHCYALSQRIFQTLWINHQKSSYHPFQSLLVALPLIIFKGLTHQIHSYLPLQSIQLTKEVMSQSFPSNILAYLFICLIWGFWEGFNYVVIAEKIRIRFPSPYSWLDSGAITCAIFCLLIHGIIGFDIYTLFESLTVFILIYGMLAIQKHNKNSWGYVMLFLLIWNAFQLIHKSQSY